MIKPDFDWTLIRSFLAVLEAGSLSGAARRLGAQQPTLGRHVAELEAQLGGALFERTGRGLTPTTLARQIAAAATQMQAAADSLGRAAQGQQTEASGTVRITASEMVAAWLLPPLLTELQRQEPGIAIELVASNQISNLLRREADIAVRMVQPTQGTLLARRIASMGMGAYAHEDYLRRAGVPQGLSDLREHRLIGMDNDDSLLRGFQLAGLPVRREDFALRTDNHIVYGRLLATGAGVGFATHYNARQWPGLRLLLPEVEIPPLPCWLTVHREIHGNRVIRRVYDFLGEAIPAALI